MGSVQDTTLARVTFEPQKLAENRTTPRKLLQFLDGSDPPLSIREFHKQLSLHIHHFRHTMTDTTTTTLTAEKEVFTQLIDEAVEKKFKSMPDRTQLKALTNTSNAVLHGSSLWTGKLPSSGDAAKDRAKILKTFRFFNAIAENDRVELRQIMSSYEPEYIKTLAPQVEATNNIGGYLVPPEFYADVLFLLNQYGFARKYCATIAMRTNVLNVSTLSGKPSVAWTDENQTIAASKGTFGRLTLTAKKLAAIYPISNELLMDANVDVYNTIAQIFVEVFGQEEDTQVFRGTGSPFTGILHASGLTTTFLGGSSTSGKTKYTDISLDDLIQLVQSVGPAQQRGASLFVEQNTLTDLLKKKDANQRYLWDITNSDSPAVNGANGLNGVGLTFRGYPVVSLPNGVLINGYDVDDHVSTPFALFGNLRSAGCWLGTHGGMETRVSNDATADGVNAFTNDLQMLRMTERLAFGVGLPANIAALSTSAS
jgi:HK97 family phage major capsid protein